MKAKFTSGVTPFRGKYQGGVYQSFSAGNQILSNKRNSRSRYPNQYLTAAIMAKVTRAWAFLTSGERSDWNVWAATYPQPCRYRSGCYLTGYQNFLQRNFYELLFFGINAPLITNPALSVIADSLVTPQLTRSGADLLLNYNWSRSGGDIWAGVFVSHIISQGKLYNLNYPRFVGVIDNGGGFTPVYGCLYNFYAVVSPSLFAPVGYHIPTRSELSNWIISIGGVSVVGGFLKSVGIDFWNYPNSGAVNSYGYNGRGSGSRIFSNGIFSSLKSRSFIWSSTPYLSYAGYVRYLDYNSIAMNESYSTKRYGHSIRLWKDSTSKAEGELGSLVGNDNKVYPTVVIGGKEVMACDSCETKFRDGSDIPYISVNSAWSALASPGMCYYNNDQSLAYSSGSTAADISPGWSKNFGVLPAVGDYVILRFVKVGKANGQFLGVEQYTIPIT